MGGYMEDSSNSDASSNQITVRVNPKLYPLEAVYSAAYVFMDKAYIVLDGDPQKEILVKIKLKPGCSAEDIKGEFNNELLNYADYLARASNTKEIREMFLERAIITNDPRMAEPEAPDEGLFENVDDGDEDFLDDPDGIAIPWEEKYGKKEASEEDESKVKQ
jgi:His-Xaa-Ser system protein HxsD